MSFITQIHYVDQIQYTAAWSLEDQDMQHRSQGISKIVFLFDEKKTKLEKLQGSSAFLLLSSGSGVLILPTSLPLLLQVQRNHFHP